MLGKNPTTLREKIGQLIVVRASGFLFDQQIRYPQWEPRNQTLQHWLETLNLGGVILLGGSAADLVQRTQQLQAWSPTPLLLAADIEEGVGQRFSGATWFPPPMALGEIAKHNLTEALALARQFGYFTAQEALALGLNWILAPIADVNNNPDNPVINIRAFGDDPVLVGHLVQAFIEGAQAYPVLTTAKHFPGHGDTSTDSHLHLPIISHSLERLQALELPPFQRAIATDVDTVMTAHICVPAWDAEHPATLSPAILTGQLREVLGFSGLIVTDALIMGGVAQFASPDEVAIQALLAGADILLMPPDPVATIAAVEQAVLAGRISENRIDQSFERIQKAKAKLVNPNPPAFPAMVATTEARQTVDQILQGSQRCGGSLPWSKKIACNHVIVVDDLLNCDFLDRACPAVKIPARFGSRPRLLDQASLTQEALGSGPLILQLFVRGNPFRGIAGLTETTQAVYKQLLRSGQLQALLLYGSPYVLDWFLPQLDPALPWVFSYGQMPQAQALAWNTLLGEMTDSLERGQDVFI
ncbi:glycoside hydrolase family 3 N-terminal domain-containing protein [Synechocystis sp. LKSZ1]|uniref:glycoside hydrolase family 3 N-terminal domain-containing protein n=1 Tax=Synechocystis sp. LKSZ1 TaxID=3144951 RepID=UPI00336C260A